MAVSTWLHIFTEDAQHQKATLTFRVKDIAFAAAQTLPAPAKIEAVINAIFSDTGKPSDAIVTGYSIEVLEDAADLGGFGQSAISSTIKTRSAVDAIPGNYLTSIPGMNKAAVSWNTNAPSTISMVGAMWDAVRAALADAAIAVGDPAGAYVATTEDEIMTQGSGVDGKRAAPRPR